MWFKRDLDNNPYLWRISFDHKKRRHKTVPLTMDINPYEETETNQNSRQMDMLRQCIARHPTAADNLQAQGEACDRVLVYFVEIVIVFALLIVNHRK